MRQLTPGQVARILYLRRRWESSVEPCGINRFDAFNPCLPEEIDGRIACVTCFTWQRHAITTGDRT